MLDQLSRRDMIKSVASTGVAGVLAGCAGMGGGGSVKVSSKQFTEQELLGYMALESLKANTDLTVKDEIGLGGTTTNFKALKEGQVDVYWEYTGTAWSTLPPSHDKVITDPKKLYNKLDENWDDQQGLEYLKRAPFNNTYVLTANPDWVKKTGVETISDLAKYINDGNTDFTVVMNAEFQSRQDGWPGLAKHYGFAGVRKKLNVKNIGSGLTYQVVGEGEAAVGMGFNTNPKIPKFNLKVLKDDQGFFPVYNPAPIVNQKALDNHPAMKSALNKIGPNLTTDKIRKLNQKVSLEGKDANKVAKQFLKDAGVI
ncbi:glycine/betaine ABC transporter substrate-binding protein [Halorussus limi]|uniref:Glycine/betaine ABC transporter substrate-binding protein n=1 Tax=Halorussus limi TaxID=2938695 RepID=A0A8U0HWS3_9EURY|nr:glycine betaine ABC transporter substrate-binding protein [Halorussus limi]UPV75223.1 glycine/betaine ABC transporter substrate-binding protein [Halorussus limi]